MFHEDAAGGWQLVAVDVNKPQGRAPACLQVQYNTIFKTHPAKKSVTSILYKEVHCSPNSRSAQAYGPGVRDSI